jgi:membrane protease YdiL (CAAX protease family)
MNAHDFAAEERQVRKKAGLWICGCLLVTAALLLLGAPRFAVVSAVLAFSFAVLGWGPSERRVAPDQPDKPCRVVAPAPAAATFVGLAVQTIVLLPRPPYVILPAGLAVVFAYAWLRARRWPRFDPPTP